DRVRAAAAAPHRAPHERRGNCLVGIERRGFSRAPRRMDRARAWGLRDLRSARPAHRQPVSRGEGFNLRRVRARGRPFLQSLALLPPTADRSGLLEMATRACRPPSRRRPPGERPAGKSGDRTRLDSIADICVRRTAVQIAEGAMPAKNILLICGTLNQTKAMMAIGRELADHNCYYTPFYCDGHLL